MNLQPTFTNELLEKLKDLSYDNQLKLVFEWVKTGHVSLAVFRTLVHAISGPDEQDLTALQQANHRMGELWERHQGKGWPEKESAEFVRLRDEIVPKYRNAILGK